MTRKEKILYLQQLEAGLINVDDVKSENAAIVIYSGNRFKMNNTGEWLTEKEMESITQGCEVQLLIPHNGRDYPTLAQ